MLVVVYDYYFTDQTVKNADAAYFLYKRWRHVCAQNICRTFLSSLLYHTLIFLIVDGIFMETCNV